MRTAGFPAQDGFALAPADTPLAPGDRADTIRPDPGVPMDSAPAQQPCNRRLADQLQALTTLAESLTVRVLELEERLQLQEELLQLQAVADGDAQQQELELRLEDTDTRLLHIEALLQGADRPAAGRHLQGLPHPPLQQGIEPIPGEARTEDPEALFPEDGEQPFMDELVA